MKPIKEQIEAYKEMAKTSPDSMKAKIEANLKSTCDKYAGHEDKLDDCIAYLTDCAREILDSKSGDVPDKVCYRICRDYFNDELWNVEEVKTKFPTCRVCGREVINVYKEGMCLDCYYKRPMQAEKTPARTAQIQPEPGQLDFFEAMGV